MNKRATQPKPIDYKILSFIQNYRQKNPNPPSIREICKAVRISSTSVVNYRLEFLRELKLLRKVPKVSRGLGLTKQGKALLKSRPS